MVDNCHGIADSVRDPLADSLIPFIPTGSVRRYGRCGPLSTRAEPSTAPRREKTFYKKFIDRLNQTGKT